jgi:phosphonate transport system ATP-binding protein
MPAAEPAVVFENVTKQFPNGHVALKNVSLTFERGEFVVVVGLSGAGKSTLIRCVNRLVTPTSGRVIVDGTDVTALGRRRPAARAGEGRHDLPKLQPGAPLVRFAQRARGPAGLPARVAHAGGPVPPPGRGTRAHQSGPRRHPEKAYQRADTLSGGQQQRVAIARALAQRPTLLLADEPVASLDPPTAHQVMRDLKRLGREENLTTLVNLHFVDMAMEYADRVVGLRAGEVVFDGPATGMTEATFEQIYGRQIRPDDLRGGPPLMRPPPRPPPRASPPEAASLAR